MTDRERLAEVEGQKDSPPKQSVALSAEQKVEAAGIEPTSDASPKAGSSRDFVASVSLAGCVASVHRDGKHANFHLVGDSLWNFEPLEQAIPKLEYILTAARLAQEATGNGTG